MKRADLIDARPPRIGLGLAMFVSKSDANVEKLIVELEQYCAESASELRWWIDDDDESWKSVTQELLAYPRRRLLDKRRRKQRGYWAHVHGGSDANDSHPRFASLMVFPELDQVYGVLEMWGDDSLKPDELLERALGTAKALQPVQGYAGLALAPQVEKRIRQASREVEFALSQRYEGIEIPGHWVTTNAKLDSLQTVQWLTIVGDALLAPLGGRAALTDLPAKAVLHDYGSGVLIQAGAAPDIGDVNKPDKLALYRAVARKLAPIRIKQPLPFNIEQPNSLSRDETAKWFKRLERDP